VYAPGETLKAKVLVRPFKEPRKWLSVSLALPRDLPEGSYTATISDEPSAMRAQLRENPTLSEPTNLDDLFESLYFQTAARRTNLAVRVPMPAAGVTLEGKAFARLPGSMVHILGSSRRTGAQALGSALNASQSTPWVLHGSESVRFAVAKNRRTSDLRSED
jgi:hypothetical protein